MPDWRRHARDALAHGPAAMVTVLATEGSAPRGPGARMIVTAGAQSGSIGGGALEHQAAAQARTILGLPPGSWRIQDYPLGPLLGQCCGGRVRLMVERLAGVPEEDGPFAVKLGELLDRSPVSGDGRVPASCAGIVEPGLRRGTVEARGPRPEKGDGFVEPEETDTLPVLMFGAGHVGRAVMARAGGLPLHIGWYDSRPEFTEIPGAVLADEDAMAECAAAAPAEAAVVILTHDHALDYRLAAAALRGRAGHVGLIGSRTKRARFQSRFDAEGIDAARLACPIGLPGVKGKEPEVIAISILAQLLQLRDAA
ncbi:xanthine dehydrogenase accessory protein XdhC [Sphingomonas canadensis]|uniref:Xanthine dehydrogenase accessory protein XdhC n=1 Tax=Sphingomonas canadensis TaxID=1219257 RepID=A0ABW3HE17_9SPHN|nr:xanthine dehydrogenase accessory protein XdhC [Sphingomonas canadensis]MCW3837408.1 xanthine dehydrogenase accessory protein XdhC [Sphingomonas canadensis]